jgi:hypothetical protein
LVGQRAFFEQNHKASAVSTQGGSDTGANIGAIRRAPRRLWALGAVSGHRWWLCIPSGGLRDYRQRRNVERLKSNILRPGGNPPASLRPVTRFFLNPFIGLRFYHDGTAVHFAQESIYADIGQK